MYIYLYIPRILYMGIILNCEWFERIKYPEAFLSPATGVVFQVLGEKTRKKNPYVYWWFHSIILLGKIVEYNGPPHSCILTVIQQKQQLKADKSGAPTADLFSVHVNRLDFIVRSAANNHIKCYTVFEK